MSQAAAFLDRDGVINADFGYVGDPAKLVLLPNAAQGMMKLKQMGFLLIVVTNQSGIARGYYSESDVVDVHAKMDQLLLEKADIKPDAYFYCPHHVQGEVSKYRVDCDCRKPKPGLIDQALDKFDINLAASFMVGDKESDIKAGLSKGIAAYQIKNQNYPMTDLATKSITDLVELANFLSALKKQAI